MRIVAWIVLGIICFSLLAMIYYLIVGKIIFNFALSRKCLQDRIVKKELQKLIDQQKINLCWWGSVKFKKVTIQSFDGVSLIGHYYDLNSKNTAVVVHGFGGDYREMQPYCKMFGDRKFNVLAVENRAHGNSEGSCIGLGWLDRKDLLCWLEFLQRHYPENKTVVFGLSMGATATCCLAGEKLPDNVVALISDCAFANANNQLDWGMKKIKVCRGLIKSHLYSFVKRFYDFDIMQADAVKQVKNSQTPILYVHANKDEIVPVENVYHLYEATPQNLREKFVVEDCGHCLCYSKAGIIYEEKIFDFLKRRTVLK